MLQKPSPRARFGGSALPPGLPLAPKPPFPHTVASSSSIHITDAFKKAKADDNVHPCCCQSSISVSLLISNSLVVQPGSAQELSRQTLGITGLQMPWGSQGIRFPGCLRKRCRKLQEPQSRLINLWQLPAPPKQ